MSGTPRKRARRYADNISDRKNVSVNDQMNPIRATSATTQLSPNLKSPRDVFLRRYTSIPTVTGPITATRSSTVSPRSASSRIPVRRHDHEGDNGVRVNFCGSSPRPQPSSCSLQLAGSVSSRLPKAVVPQQQQQQPRREASAANSSTGIRDTTTRTPPSVGVEAGQHLYAVSGQCSTMHAIGTAGCSTWGNDALGNTRRVSLVLGQRVQTRAHAAQQHPGQTARGNSPPTASVFGEAHPTDSTTGQPVDIIQDDPPGNVRPYAPGHVKRMAAQLKIDPTCLRPRGKQSTTAGCLAYARDCRSKGGSGLAAPITATCSQARATQPSDRNTGCCRELVKANVAESENQKNVVRQAEDKSSTLNEVPTRWTRIDESPESGAVVRAQCTATSSQSSNKTATTTTMTTGSRWNKEEHIVEEKGTFAKTNARSQSPRIGCNTSSQTSKSSASIQPSKQPQRQASTSAATAGVQEHDKQDAREMTTASGTNVWRNRQTCTSSIGNGHGAARDDIDVDDEAKRTAYKLHLKWIDIVDGYASLVARTRSSRIENETSITDRLQVLRLKTEQLIEMNNKSHGDDGACSPTVTDGGDTSRGLADTVRSLNRMSAAFKELRQKYPHVEKVLSIQRKEDATSRLGATRDDEKMVQWTPPAFHSQVVGASRSVGVLEAAVNGVDKRRIADGVRVVPGPTHSVKSLEKQQRDNSDADTPRAGGLAEYPAKRSPEPKPSMLTAGAAHTVLHCEGQFTCQPSATQRVLPDYLALDSAFGYGDCKVTENESPAEVLSRGLNSSAKASLIDKQQPMTSPRATVRGQIDRSSLTASPGSLAAMICNSIDDSQRRRQRDEQEFYESLPGKVTSQTVVSADHSHHTPAAPEGASLRRIDAIVNRREIQRVVNQHRPEVSEKSVVETTTGELSTSTALSSSSSFTCQVKDDVIQMRRVIGVSAKEDRITDRIPSSTNRQVTLPRRGILFNHNHETSPKPETVKTTDNDKKASKWSISSFRDWLSAQLLGHDKLLTDIAQSSTVGNASPPVSHSVNVIPNNRNNANARWTRSRAGDNIHQPPLRRAATFELTSSRSPSQSRNTGEVSCSSTDNEDVMGTKHLRRRIRQMTMSETDVNAETRQVGAGGGRSTYMLASGDNRPTTRDGDVAKMEHNIAFCQAQMRRGHQRHRRDMRRRRRSVVHGEDPTEVNGDNRGTCAGVKVADGEQRKHDDYRTLEAIESRSINEQQTKPSLNNSVKSIDVGHTRPMTTGHRSARGSVPHFTDGSPATATHLSTSDDEFTADDWRSEGRSLCMKSALDGHHSPPHTTAIRAKDTRFPEESRVRSDCGQSDHCDIDFDQRGDVTDSSVSSSSSSIRSVQSATSDFDDVGSCRCEKLYDRDADELKMRIYRRLSGRCEQLVLPPNEYATVSKRQNSPVHAAARSTPASPLAATEPQSSSTGNFTSDIAPRPRPQQTRLATLPSASQNTTGSESLFPVVERPASTPPAPSSVGSSSTANTSLIPRIEDRQGQFWQNIEYLMYAVYGSVVVGVTACAAYCAHHRWLIRAMAPQAATVAAAAASGVEQASLVVSDNVHLVRSALSAMTYTFSPTFE